MERIVQRILLIFFALSLVLFGAGYYRTRLMRDVNGPTIRMEETSIMLSVQDPEEAILRGMEAHDGKDGDVSASLVIQSMSNFVEKGWRQVTVAAFDSDNNVTKATRDVRSSDYVSPRFSIRTPLVFAVGEKESTIIRAVQAQDCLDGDLSASITVELEDREGWLDSSSAGETRLVYTVINSAGDVASLPVTVQICDYRDTLAASALLSSNLVYLPRGTDFEPRSYFVGVMKNEEQIPFDGVVVQMFSTVDSSKPGVYEVRFTVTDTEEETETTRCLYVIVE